MLKIIQITDIHLLAQKTDTLYGINPYVSLKNIVDKIYRIREIDCIIITGDIADKGEYDAYIIANNLFNNINVPVYWLQGNHDFAEVMLQISPRINIKSDKSFIINNTKFILLQSVMRDEDDLSKNKGRGYLFDYEMSFTKRELEENNFQNCVVALHHPPILSNTWTDRRILDNRTEFLNLLEQYPKVKLVLYGHQHIAQHTFINGINYISSPPTSFHYDPNGEKFSILKDRQGFGIISIDDNGVIDLQNIFIDL